MNRIFTLLVVILTLLAPSAMATSQNNYTLRGRVVNENNQPIEFATVVLLAPDSTQRTGIATDSKGHFALSTLEGEAIVTVQYVGYAPYCRSLNITESTDLGDISIAPATNSVGEVVVTARLITREADRFVVDVANNPAVALGKDGMEILATAPGVWIQGDNISINGASGTRIMVNERMLNLTGDDLAAYLRALNAEDVQKIEVIPVSGADYDANSSGGIIKITMRKPRRDGVTGSVQTRVITNKYNPFYIVPSARVSYHRGRTTINASANYTYDHYMNEAIESTQYLNSSNSLTGYSMDSIRNQRAYASLGAVYEVNDRHSIGAEGYYQHSTTRGRTSSTSTFDNGATTDNQSLYTSREQRGLWSVTANYIAKLDTLGSTFKLIGDLFSQVNDDHDDYLNHSTTAGFTTDSTYRSVVGTDYRIYSLSAALEKNFNSKTSLRVGAKYTRNEMNNDLLYEYLSSGAWNIHDGQTIDINFTENIAAAYAIVNTKLGKVGVNAGLRLEYTHSAPRTEGEGDKSTYAKREYVSLFPHANISVPLNKKQSTSLVATYARTIGRPSFWQLSPYRTQMTEYSYVTGNPHLKPVYNNNFTMTAIFGYKYTISFTALMQENYIAQIAHIDPTNPNLMLYRHDNMDSNWNFWANV
ncbi:MAG: TonB-dependent receptor, partial [Rikenellaceae bacterium]|nr:TonB-dependent receptor [Rikenellaceae bacterium]